MPKRETFTTGIKCGNCDATGEANFTENENPVYTRGDYNRVTNWVSEGFKIAGDGPMGIACACGSDKVDQA